VRLPALLPLLGALNAAAQTPVMTVQTSGVTARLQAVSAVSERVAWASGARGTWVVTTDGGATWRAGTVPGADSLEFRDVHAVDARAAWLLAAGPGARSRIYHTTDGGATWTEQWANADPDAFYDCFAFWDRRRALAFSDNVRGVFPVLATDDGTTWRLRSDPADTARSLLPRALGSEGAFAASGSCVAAGANGWAWIATGAGERARLFTTRDRGRTWSVSEPPGPPPGATRGFTSVAFRDSRVGVVAGGDVGDNAGANATVAVTRDGGRTWTAGGQPLARGAVFGVAWVPGTEQLVAVGPGGASWSRDGGSAWLPLDALSYWSVAVASPAAGWLVGPGGRIAKWRVTPGEP
jgi:photosystem II stability/assembly factor-like uncharacterized protein